MDEIWNEEIRRRVNMQPAEQTANKTRWWSYVSEDGTNSSPEIAMTEVTTGCADWVKDRCRIVPTRHRWQKNLTSKVLVK